MKFRDYHFAHFKPKLVNDLIRVGNKEKDGGYVISKRQVDKTKILIGLGVNYDWSFEEEFKSLNNSVNIYCYDFSVGKSVYLKSFISSLINVVSPSSYTKEIFNKRSPVSVFTKPVFNIKTYFNFKSFFKAEKGNFFFQKGISDFSGGVFITVPEMFNNVKSFKDLPDNSVYLKMDIEESEYDVLEDILEQSSKINGLSIEFHNIKHLWNDFNLLAEKLKKDFEIIHVHGNNCCGYIHGTEIPNLIEVSYMKRNLLTDDELNSVNQRKYPLEKLDSPNLPNIPDLTMSFK